MCLVVSLVVTCGLSQVVYDGISCSYCTAIKHSRSPSWDAPLLQTDSRHVVPLSSVVCTACIFADLLTVLHCCPVWHGQIEHWLAQALMMKQKRSGGTGRAYYGARNNGPKTSVTDSHVSVSRSHQFFFRLKHETRWTWRGWSIFPPRYTTLPRFSRAPRLVYHHPFRCWL